MSRLQAVLNSLGNNSNAGDRSSSGPAAGNSSGNGGGTLGPGSLPSTTFHQPAHGSHYSHQRHAPFGHQGQMGDAGSAAGEKSITPKPDQIDFSKIFVGGLSWSSTEETLTQYFQQFGTVVKVEIMKDRVTGNPRGFCFIIFDSDDAVEKIVNHGKHVVDEKVVDVKRAQARGQAPPSIHCQRGSTNTAGSGGPGGGSSYTAVGIRSPQHAGGGSHHHSHQSAPQAPSGAAGSSAAGGVGEPDTSVGLSPEQLMNKLFVGGLHLAVDKEEMKTYFEQYGPVVDSIVMMDQMQGRSRGFGFITYEEGSEGAQKAMKAAPHSLRDKFVEIKYAQPKAAQQAGVAAAGVNSGSATHAPNNATGGTGHAPPQGGTAAEQTSGRTGLLGVVTARSNNINSEYYGLAGSYGRNGWKAGYGTLAFGQFGWKVEGWETFSFAQFPEPTGFSFDMLKDTAYKVTEKDTRYVVGEDDSDSDSSSDSSAGDDSGNKNITEKNQESAQERNRHRNEERNEQGASRRQKRERESSSDVGKRDRHYMSSKRSRQ